MTPPNLTVTVMNAVKMSVESSDTTQLPITETVEVLKSCHKCGKTGLQRLKSHLHTMHAEKVNVTFADGTRRTVFRESDDPTEGSSFRCPRCQRIYYNTMQLQRHTKHKCTGVAPNPARHTRHTAVTDDADYVPGAADSLEARAVPKSRSHMRRNEAKANERPRRESQAGLALSAVALQAPETSASKEPTSEPFVHGFMSSLTRPLPQYTDVLTKLGIRDEEDFKVLCAASGMTDKLWPELTKAGISWLDRGIIESGLRTWLPSLMPTGN